MEWLDGDADEPATELRGLINRYLDELEVLPMLRAMCPSEKQYLVDRLEWANKQLHCIENGDLWNRITPEMREEAAETNTGERQCKNTGSAAPAVGKFSAEAFMNCTDC